MLFEAILEKFGPTIFFLCLAGWVGYNYLNGLSQIKLQRAALENQMFQQTLEDRDALRTRYENDQTTQQTLGGQGAEIKAMRDLLEQVLRSLTSIETRLEKIEGKSS